MTAADTAAGGSSGVGAPGSDRRSTWPAGRFAPQRGDQGFLRPVGGEWETQKSGTDGLHEKASGDPEGDAAERRVLARGVRLGLNALLTAITICPIAQ